MTIAETIFNQLGGNRFVAMTGAKNFVSMSNGLRFKIGRNGSKANTVTITLNGLDLYDMSFTYFKAGHLKIDYKKMTCETIPDKFETIKEFNDVYCDQLQELFTDVTKLYTRL